MLKVIIYLYVFSWTQSFHSELIDFKNDKNYIFWHDRSKLEWIDFKGKEKKNSDLVASCNTYIEMEIFNDSVLVKTVFNKKKSWIRKNQADDYLLNHEQGHFNITEIYARILRKKISKLSRCCRGKNRINRIYRTVVRDCYDFQIKYDFETNHSINTIKQLEWDSIIEQRLYENQMFSNHVVLVK